MTVAIRMCKLGAKLLGHIPLWTLLACGTVSKSLTLSEAMHRSQFRLHGLKEIKGESCLMHGRCPC